MSSESLMPMDEDLILPTSPTSYSPWILMSHHFPFESFSRSWRPIVPYPLSIPPLFPVPKHPILCYYHTSLRSSPLYSPFSMESHSIFVFTFDLAFIFKVFNNKTIILATIYSVYDMPGTVFSTLHELTHSILNNISRFFSLFYR